MSVVDWTDGVTLLNAANLDTLESLGRKGQANGYASLDGTGKVPLAQLPDAASGAYVPLDGVQVAGTRILASKLVGTDAQPAFRIMGDGKHEWGLGGATVPDVSLYREFADILSTDGRLIVARGSADEIWLGYIGGSLGGGITFGSARDIAIYRSAASRLEANGLFAAQAFASSAYGTSLPASPINGQEYTLVDSTTNPTYQWRFRYNAGSSSGYKWEFVGGSPKLLDSGTTGVLNTLTQVGTSGWWYPAGLAFVVPRSGEYVISGSARLDRSTADLGTAQCGAFSATFLGRSVASEIPVGVFWCGLAVTGATSIVSAATTIGLCATTSNPGGTIYNSASGTIIPKRVQ